MPILFQAPCSFMLLIIVLLKCVFYPFLDAFLKNLKGACSHLHVYLSVWASIYPLRTILPPDEFSLWSCSKICPHNSVLISTRGAEVRAPVGSKMFTSPCRPDRLWGSPNLLKNGYRGSFPGVKRHEREADHSPPTSAEVKKMWIYASTPSYVFMA
jgi:hypothetical protein